MGNSVHAELQGQKHSLSPASADPRYDYLSHWKNSNGDLFLARQVEIPESIGLLNLKRRLQNRQNLSPQASCLYPLDRCYFEHMSSMCSQQERCILTCRKPKNNLDNVFEERKLSGISFTSEEINLVLSNISKSLKSLLDLGEQFCSLRMSHIAIDNNVQLIDPILIESDPFGYGSLGEYPAPQQFREEEEILSKESLMLTPLFSLGVIGLQLCHSKAHVKGMYERYHKYGNIVSLNMQILNQYVANVSDPYLRAKISTLTSFNPQTRKNIYQFIEKQNITSQKKQAIVRQLHVCKPLLLSNPPLSPLIKNIPPIKQQKALKQLNQNHSISPISPINKHLHLQKQQVSKENIAQKPKVSINFVTKIHNSSNNQNNTKKSITFNNTLKKEVINHQHQSKNHSNISEQTPLRAKKRHNFSTIKQVSEYDECTSTSRMHIVQDLSINGRYEGQLLEGNRHGKGIFYFQQGSIYEGQWKDDQMHGYGKLYYPSGKLAYEGGWKYNQFSGRGKVYNDEPRVFREPFDFTDFNQLGEEWTYYEGNLEQDQRQGKGCLVLSNGQKINGEFLYDKIHGFGEFSTLSGKIIRGIWNQSILQRTFIQ